MRYKKGQSWLMDVSLFAELEEELGLIRKIHFKFPCDDNSGGLSLFEHFGRLASIRF